MIVIIQCVITESIIYIKSDYVAAMFWHHITAHAA